MIKEAAHRYGKILIILVSILSNIIMRSLSHDAAVVLVHAFVASRIDHSCSVLVGLPLGLIGRLDRVLRYAARLIGHIPNYSSVSAYMHDVLRWLPVSQRILYRISALVWRSVTGCAPSYLTDLCRPVSDLASGRALRSSARGELLVLRARSAQRRSFSVIDPSTWNELPLTLRLLPQNNMSSFCKLLKTFLFDHSWPESASE